MVQSSKRSQIDNICLLEVKATEQDIEFLYELLSERTSVESISHKKMPTKEQHSAFVWGKPYLRWWLILAVAQDGECYSVGATYLSRADHFQQHYLGISILKRYRRKGYASEALRQVLKECKYLGIAPIANINPANLKSIKLFEKLGFKQIQVSYKKEL